MSNHYEITCINKTNRTSPHECIANVGGVGWELPVQGAVRAIETQQASFYVNRGGRRVDVIVAISPQGHKYLKTISDGFLPNNLLSLPECR
jgi:hypothetical protein